MQVENFINIKFLCGIKIKIKLKLKLRLNSYVKVGNLTHVTFTYKQLVYKRSIYGFSRYITDRIAWVNNQ